MREQILSQPARVASLAPRSVEDARGLLALVPEGAEAIEYRLDLASERIPAAALSALDPRPAIVTWRRAEEGGSFRGSSPEYRALLSEAYATGASVDVELSSGLLSDPDFLPDRRRVVASLHAPFGLPADWEERLAALLATGARAVKLVAGVGDLAASLRLAEIQKRAPACAAVFPMGPASPPGRVLSAFLGASLVYGGVGEATAPGQLSLSELLDTYGVADSRPVEALFGIVGREVSGSLSPLVHNTLFRRRGVPSLYLPLPVADWERSDPTRLESDPPLVGFSVTRPWKRRAAVAGRASEDVAATGAANTLRRERGAWRAENTDVDGVFDPLADHDTGEGRTAVVLGAGGAARAAVAATRRLGYELLVASRRDSEADALAAAAGVDSLAFADLAASEADLYVNATPVGFQDEDPPAFPAPVLDQRPLVFDCVYRRDGRETSTIRAARAARCPTIDGLAMFAAQAARQARIFGVADATAEEIAGILEASFAKERRA